MSFYKVLIIKNLESMEVVLFGVLMFAFFYFLAKITGIDKAPEIPEAVKEIPVAPNGTPLDGTVDEDVAESEEVIEETEAVEEPTKDETPVEEPTKDETSATEETSETPVETESTEALTKELLENCDDELTESLMRLLLNTIEPDLSHIIKHTVISSPQELYKNSYNLLSESSNLNFRGKHEEVKEVNLISLKSKNNITIF